MGITLVFLMIASFQRFDAMAVRGAPLALAVLPAVFAVNTQGSINGERDGGGSDHPGLYGWWRFWHHRIGKILA